MGGWDREKTLPETLEKCPDTFSSKQETGDALAGGVT